MSAVQYDSRGRPFIMGPTGEIVYLSPASMGNSEGSGLGEGGNFFKSDGQWNQRTGEVERPTNWGNILSTVIGGGLGAQGLAAAGAFGGGGAAGGAGLPTTGMTPGLIGEGAAAAGSGAAAAGAGAASSLPGWIKPAIGLGAPLAMRAMRRGPGNEYFGGGGSSGDGNAQLQQLMQLLMEKAQRTAPVHAQAMNTAQRMGPSLASSPQMDRAIDASRSSRPATQTDPQVLAAIQRLMGGR